MPTRAAFFLLLTSLLLAACGGAPAAPPDEERIARRVAEIMAAQERKRVAQQLAAQQASEAAGAGARTEGARPPGWPTSGHDRFRVPVGEAPARGAAAPLVTIALFSDFECPFCARVVPTIEQMLTTYPNEVRLVFMHNPLPFHQHAALAAQAAIEARRQQGDRGFWQMHDLLFRNRQALVRVDLEGYARAMGLDMTRFRGALDANLHTPTIERDQAVARRIGANGTPHFVINGRKIAGAQPFERFATMIDEEIAFARQAMEAGVPRGQLYAAAQRNARLDAPAPNRRPDRAPRPRRDPSAIYRVPVGSEPSRGPATALATIVIFSDFQCPFCSRVLPTLEQIRTRYGNDVRFVYMNNPLPFHQSAGPAAEAALEAHAQGGNRKFWAMHDLLFQNQRQLERADLERYARQIGLNLRRFRRALDRHTHEATITAQRQLAASLGASGTPGFFINGRQLPGAQPFQAFETVINEEMTRARAAVTAGIPRRRLYEEMIRNGATTPQTLPAGAAP